VANVNDIRAIVGDVLRRHREGADLTQEQVGRLAKLHRNYIGSVERGERNISIEALEQWLDALGVSWTRWGHEVDVARAEARRRARAR
jgi:transcriptional regulator with XRE-family HTH domain